MMKLIGWTVLLAAASLGTARAATLYAADMAQLVRMSDYVVLAKAEARTTRRVESSGLIVTDVKLRVTLPLKGQAKAGEALTATLLGGSIGDVALSVPGEATIPDDRGAIVFLRKTANGELNVSGMGQGVLLITGQGAAAMVNPPSPEAALVQNDGKGKLQPAEPMLTKPQPLNAIMQQIRDLVSAPANTNGTK